MSYIARRPSPRPRPRPGYSAMCHARQVMFVAFDQWVSEARPSAADVDDEILATASVLAQLAALRGVV